MPGSATGSAGGTAPPASAREVVLDHELPQGAALRLEDPPAVAAADLLHETDQARVVVEHEHVDRGAAAGGAPPPRGRRRGRLPGGRPSGIGGTRRRQGGPLVARR